MSAVCVFDSTASAIFDDPAGAALIDEYERECANPVLGPTQPQRKLYEALEGCGVAHCFAGEVDGVLRGFAFYLMGTPPHYGDKKCATVESLFVSSEARGGGLGGQLMEAIEKDAKANGCVAILYSAPVGSRLARLLFLSTDRYRNTNHTFTRAL